MTPQVTNDQLFRKTAADFSRTEAEALALARDHGGLAIVDLDETLYLRNSTEQFISLAMPALGAALLLRLLDILAPWRWTGGSDCRDNWRLMLVLCMFPWTMGRWRRFCQNQAMSFINMPLRDALFSRPSGVVVASNGYRRVIRPLLAGFALPEARLICCDLRRFRHRTGGKLELVRPYITDVEIAGSTVITDSITDAPLLSVCNQPSLTIWKKARFERALHGLIYLPGDYLNKVKRPRQGALRRLAREDVLPWVLAGLSIRPTLLDAAGLLVLFFSMWCFYELGYHDNDQCALRYEDDGKTTPEVQTFVTPGLAARMAGTGILFGVLGIYLLTPDQWLITGAAWFAGMAALTGIYRWYNRIDKNSRVWLYLPLQLFRSGALFLVVSGTGIGMALAGSQIIARWIDYILYRYVREINGNADFPQRPQRAVRLLLLLLLLAPLLLTGDWTAFAVPATLAFPLFLYDAVRWDLSKIRRHYYRLDR